MKIQKLNENYSIAPRANQKRIGGAQPQFKGNLLSNADIIMRELPQGKTLRILEKFNYFKGERGGILFTAFGTGLVAPIFIAFNPFVRAPKNATPEEKEEVRNTKAYTAMRQPISAVLAAIFQAGVLDYIDRGLDALTNNPELSKYWDVVYDQSSLNKKEYLVRQVKKQLKRADFSSKKDYEAAVKAKVSAIQKQQLDAMASAIRRNGQIVINEKEVPGKVLAEVINSQIDEYMKSARALKIETDPQKTKSKISGIEFYKNRASLLVKNEDEINRLFDIKADNVLLNQLKELQKNSQDPNLNVILENAINSFEDNKIIKYNEGLVESLKNIKTEDAELKTFASRVVELFEENLSGNDSEAIVKNKEKILEFTNQTSSATENADIKKFITKIEKSLDDNQVFKYDKDLVEYLKNCAKTSENPEIKTVINDILKNQISKDKVELSNYLKDILNTTENEDIKLLINEILERDNILVQSSRMKRTVERIKKVKSACGGTFDKEKYGEYLEEGNNIIDRRIKELDALHIGERVEKVKKGKTVVSYNVTDNFSPEQIKGKIADLIKACKYEYNVRLDQLLGSSGVFSSNNESVQSAVCKDLAKGYKKFVENTYKGFGQISKVIIGVFITLPITCTALNWVYPRFMDLVFPNLGKSKTEPPKEAEKVNGGDK